MFLHFKNINSKYALYDRHMHTNWTDGKNTIEEMIEAAEKLGMKEIALTDHVRGTSTYYNDYVRKIKYLRKKTKVNVVIGFECKIKNFDGEIDVNEEIKSSAEISIASVHSFPIGSKFYDAKKFHRDLCQDIEFELTMSALKNSKFDILGHPGGVSLRYHNNFDLKYFEQIVIECVKKNIAFDLNYFYHFKIFPQLSKILEKYNPLVSLGSDAHESRHLGAWLNYFK
jgi:putative hydrolase